MLPSTASEVMRMAKKTRLHVNQHNVRHNKKNPDDLRPPLTVKDYTQNRKCYTADLKLPDGTVVAKLISQPNKPLSCGATVWIETELDVVTYDEAS